MAEKDQFAYSLTGEDYTGSFLTRAIAADAAIKHARRLQDPPLTVYVGRLSPALPDTHGHARPLIESMRRRAAAENRPATGQYLSQVTPEQVDELDEALAAAICQWLKQHGPPALFHVEAISEHPVPFPPEVNSGPTDEVHEIGETGFTGE
jgi:hypothetical protein